jgi:hypothetical protein
MPPPVIRQKTKGPVCADAASSGTTSPAAMAMTGRPRPRPATAQRKDRGDAGTADAGTSPANCKCNAANERRYATIQYNTQVCGDSRLILQPAPTYISTDKDLHLQYTLLQRTLAIVCVVHTIHFTLQRDSIWVQYNTIEYNTIAFLLTCNTIALRCTVPHTVRNYKDIYCKFKHL